MVAPIKLSKFEDLWQAVRSLGAKGSVQIQITKLESDGLDIKTLEDIVLGRFGLFTILPDGTISTLYC